MQTFRRLLRSEITQTIIGLAIALLLVRFWHFLPPGLTAFLVIVAGILFALALFRTVRK